MELTGAQIVWESLLREGVEVVFGYPGGQIIDVYDTMMDYPIRHILVRHEQGAAHAADGYARSTGKVGVCMATSGPGATNLVTGIATAYMDSVPIVAITGQVATSVLGKDAFQETDITGITLPITKHNYLVGRVEELATVIKEAFHIARTGRPGPVLIDLPRDVALGKTVYEYPDRVDLPGYRPTVRPNARQLKTASELMNAAARPLIIAGGGVNRAGAWEELAQLARKYRAPVAMTLLGLGSFPESDPQSLGFIGMHGAASAYMAADKADLILAVGMRFSDRVTGRPSAWAPNAKIIHIDVDPAEVGKNVAPTVPIVGDAKYALQQLVPLVQPCEFEPWWELIREWKREEAERDILNRESDEILPPYVIDRISRVTGGQALMVSDVGQNQMWEAQYYQHNRPRGLCTSGGLGTMGYAIPAAIGAQVGNPGVPVWVVAGDGGAQMTINQLGTIVQERLPIKIVVLNNGYLGMVRQWQEIFFRRRYSATAITSPDFSKIAEAYGMPGLRVDRRDEVDAAIDTAASTPGPFLLEFRVKGEENVYPMVPAGQTIREMIRRPLPTERCLVEERA
ncbi:MAG: biosynthetic-type acetolactate synthase large subunit [Anaerolineae bacterium]|nr:biosynthetic-type acetolactate synthase large subunit [Anaerolineae bacterium]